MSNDQTAPFRRPSADSEPWSDTNDVPKDAVAVCRTKPATMAPRKRGRKPGEFLSGFPRMYDLSDSISLETSRLSYELKGGTGSGVISPLWRVAGMWSLDRLNHGSLLSPIYG